MTKSTKISKKDQGCVAFAYGGVLKQNTVKLFKSSDNKPESDQETLSKWYGTITIRYVNCENYEEVYDSFVEKFTEKLVEHTNNVYFISTSTAADELKTLAGAKVAHTLNFEKEKDEQKLIDLENKRTKIVNDMIQLYNKYAQLNDFIEAEILVYINKVKYRPSCCNWFKT